MARRKKCTSFAGSHQQLTEPAQVVANAIDKAGGRVAPGKKMQNGRIRRQDVLVRVCAQESCIFLTVVSKVGKQQLSVFNLQPTDLNRALRTTGYTISQ